MKVSIVVPLYNKAPFLRRTLDSIGAQTFSDFEVIVVDDGSTDGGLEIAQAHGDPRVRTIAQANAGPGAARNRGLADAKGEFVSFLDADDAWLPDFLTRGVAALDALPEAASFTSSYIDMPADQSLTPMWRKRGLRDGVFRVNADTAPMLVASTLAFMSPCSTLARADHVRRFGGFFSRERSLFGEDQHLWLQVLMNAPVIIDLEPRVRFFRDASNLSNNLGAARPVEPFLRDPSDIERTTPAELRPLLAKVLAIRAYKTACMLGYWGQWRDAAALSRRFAVRAWPPLPYQVPALVCSTPVGAALGRGWRAIRSATS